MRNGEKENEIDFPREKGGSGPANCYIISASYGNDSIALIQWAHERGLDDCFVVYCDTGWAHPDWSDRIKKGEELAERYGFITWRMKSIGFENLVKMKKGFPSQKYQFCSGILKGIPFLDFSEFVDPRRKAIVVVGKRRAESKNREHTPEFIISSEYHEGRTVWHPLYKHSDSERDALINAAGFRPLPHRSMECCPCVNANRADLKHTPEVQLDKVRYLEQHIGKSMYRAYRHQGAVGIDEVMEWAHSARGKYNKYQRRLFDYRGNFCESGLCGI